MLTLLSYVFSFWGLPLIGYGQLSLFVFTIMYKPWAPASMQVLRRAQIALKSVEEEDESDPKDDTKKPKGKPKGKAKGKAKGKPGRPKGKAKGKAKGAARKAPAKTDAPKGGDGSEMEMDDEEDEGVEDMTGGDKGEKGPSDVGPHGFDCDDDEKPPKPVDTHHTPKVVDEEIPKPAEEKPEKPKGKRTHKDKEQGETGASTKEPVQKRVRAKKVKEDEGETGPSPKVPKKEAATFARRPEPSTQVNKMKWHALRGAFSRMIKPNVTAPSTHEAPWG